MTAALTLLIALRPSRWCRLQQARQNFAFQAPWRWQKRPHMTQLNENLIQQAPCSACSVWAGGRLEMAARTLLSVR